MPKCYVHHCKTIWKPNDSYVMMHSFPRDRNMIREWLCRLPNKNQNVDDIVEQIYSSKQGNYRICSHHFTLDSYRVNSGSKRLRKGAVPTIFMPPLCTEQEEGEQLLSHDEKTKARNVPRFVEHSYAVSTERDNTDVEALVTSEEHLETKQEEIITVIIE